MKNFSFSPEIPLKAPTAGAGFTGKLAGLASQPNLDDIAAALSDIYARADKVGDRRVACRKCAKCCRCRVVQAYAVEISYLMAPPDDAPLEITSATADPCPALSEDNSCALYERRPLACRVFQPWTRWTLIKGCADHPQDRDSAQELGAILSELANLNEMFVHRTGLHRDLDFDYLGQWSMTDWFPA